MHSALVPLGLCAALLTASMHPVGPAQDRKPVPRKAVGDVIDQMQGAWRLVELRSKKLPIERRQEAGYCIVSGIYMSLEIHVGWMGQENLIAGADFTSGMHRLDLTSDHRVRTSSLIGSYINENGKMEFEQPGKARTLAVTFNGTRMTLEREDGNRYVLEKLGDWRERRDFYGRVINKPGSETPEPPDPKEPPKDGEH